MAKDLGEKDLRRADAVEDPSPAVGSLSDTPTNGKGEENAHNTGRHVHESSLLGLVAEVADESGRVGGNDTTGNRKLAETLV